MESWSTRSRRRKPPESIYTPLDMSSSYFLSSTSAFHLGGVTSRRARARRLFYESRSRVQYAYKHFGRLRALLVLLATLLLEPVTRAVLALSRFSWKDCLTTLKGSWMLWMSIPTVLRVNRRRTQ